MYKPIIKGSCMSLCLKKWPLFSVNRNCIQDCPLLIDLIILDLINITHREYVNLLRDKLFLLTINVSLKRYQSLSRE